MLRGGAEEEEAGEEAGWYHLPGWQSPWVGPCPGPAGDGPARRSGGGAPRVEEQGGAPLGRSGEGLGEAGLPEGAAGSVGEGWGEEGCPGGRRRVKEEVEGEAAAAEEDECWSCVLLSGLEIEVCCRRSPNWSYKTDGGKKTGSGWRVRRKEEQTNINNYQTNGTLR